MRLYASALAGWVNPADAFAQLHLTDPNAFWFDRESHQSERYSVIGAAAETHWVDDPYDWMRERTKRLGSVPPADERAASLPFSWRPGLVGALLFEGPAALLQVDRAMVFDHDLRRMMFIGHFANQADFDHWHHAALLRLALVGGRLASHLHEHRAETQAEPLRASLRHAPGAYLELIERAQRHIAAGDVYQLCLTNELVVDGAPNAFATFNRLRETSPAPYAAFLRLTRPNGELLEVASSSPEQFLGVEGGGRVVTKPIKGTRPRVRTAGGNIEPRSDEAMAHELRSDTKERAENLMIVDLMRNDLARVCAPETVAVNKLFDVESYAAVHQLVSTISGQLQPGLDAIDALEATFPGGSMTGAPKLRAIELIRELEAGSRGIYSGVIGWIGDNGAADWGMTIRTMVFEASRVVIGVGGGITSDSIPAAELEETRIKARALLRVLGASDPWA